MANQIDRIIIRDAHYEDTDAIAQVHARSWQHAYRGILSDHYLNHEVLAERTTMWRERMATTPRERMFLQVAEDEYQLVGFVCVLLDEAPHWGAYLDNLHLLPHVQRRGLGRRLMAAAAGWVRTIDAAMPLHLLVFEQNHAACQFYAACGGVVVERFEKAMPGGVVRPVLRYQWVEPAQIIG
ncbi:MAG: GNAT family N-acetyltransferase [Roseiflexaceae bacterium]